MRAIPTRPRPALLVATALAATALLAGCSGGSTASGQAASPAAGAASASAPASAAASAVQGPGVSAQPAGPSAPASPQRVDVAAFASVVGQPGVTVVDVRTPQEYAAGHLDGAVNVDFESPDFAARVAELDPDATYAVYCRSGNRSASAVSVMAEAGVVHTYDLDGGIVAWEAAGNPVVS